MFAHSFDAEDDSSRGVLWKPFCANTVESWRRRKTLMVEMSTQFVDNLKFFLASCQPPPLLEDAGVRKSRRCAATIDTKDDRDSSNKNNAE